MKKGFTLVELIAAIAVLAALVTITSITIVNMVKDANEILDDGTKKLLYNSAETYLNEQYTLPANGDFKVTLETLISHDLVSDTILEIDENITNNSCVKVNITNGAMNYEFSYTCN